MNLFRLRKLRDDLLSKPNRTQEENELLAELQFLGDILNKHGSSLSAPSNVCPSCGRSLTK